MSQTTISSSVVGSVRSNLQTNWSDVQTSTSGAVVDGLTCKLEAQSWREAYRIVTIFDTSSLPDNATISNAIMRCVGDYKVDGFGGTLYARALTTASNSVVSTSDYNKANFGSSVGSLAWSSLTASGNNDITITNSHVSLTGYTKIGLIQSNDYNGADPGNDAGNTYIRFTSASLIITYTTPPAVTTGVATAIQPISATLAGNVTDAGGGTVSSRGVCWSTSANPTTANSKATSSGTTGAYTVGATGLLPGTLYYYRAYVITENSTQYGTDQTFRTSGGAILFNLL